MSAGHSKNVYIAPIMNARSILVLISLAVLAAPVSPVAQTAVSVRVDAVVNQTIERTVGVIGRLVALQRGVVAANTRGRVAEVRVQVGERVEEGDVLALLDRDRLAWRRDLAEAEQAEAKANLANAEARVGRADASLVTAKARLALAQQELERIGRLRDSVAFSQASYDDKRLEVEVAQRTVDEAAAEVAEVRTLTGQYAARLQGATAALQLADDELDDAAIRAPFPAVVTSRRTEVGAYLDLGDEVVGLVNDRELEIEADVPFRRLAGLARNAKVRFTLDDGRVFDAEIRAIGAEENPRTRTRVVRFRPNFTGATDALADGQSVTLAIPAGPRHEALTVHKDAIVREAGAAFVFVVADGLAEIRPIVLGEASGDRFEVVEGLAAGEQVVVRGNDRLQPGQSVITADPS